MNYKTVEDLNGDARRLAENLPSDIDLVVGIPRSGLLAANLLCLHLDLPMVDVDGLCEGKLFDTGSRYDKHDSLEELDTVLVLDDSVLTGGQMTETRERLSGYDFPFDVEYGAVYTSPRGHKHLDYWVEVVPSPRMFEWNVMHHTKMPYFCVDIDGVLCRDPMPEENDDGERYREFLTTVDPKVVPRQRIGCLVTSRLEKYRPETEQWLDENDIKYDRLVMMDVPDMETRQELGNYGRYKANVYNSTDAELFIESDPKQAAEICNQTNRPVYCYETNEMLNPSFSGYSRRYVSEGVSNIKSDPVRVPARAAFRYSRRFYHRVMRSVRSLNK